MKTKYPSVLLPVLLTFGFTLAQAQPPDNLTSTDSLSDAQILEVVHTLNTGEIEQAELALKKTQSDDVKKVAQTILDDHIASNDQIKKIGLPSEESVLSKKLKSDGVTVMNQLKAKDGNAFKCFYLTAQAEQHKTALSTARTVLMPNARSEAVKNFLAEMEPKLEHHQHEAQQEADKLCHD